MAKQMDGDASGVVYPDFLNVPPDVYRGLAEARQWAERAAQKAKDRAGARTERLLETSDEIKLAKLRKLIANDEYAVVRYSRMQKACEWVLIRTNDPDAEPTLFEASDEKKQQASAAAEAEVKPAESEAEVTGESAADEADDGDDDAAT